jgi:glycosyltransferase involved in cell wall biosynthesis
VTQRVLLVSPVHNEAAHLELVAAALAAQTRPPDLWLVADDGSVDDTRAILRRLETEIPFLRVVDVPQEGKPVDRLAVALEARAFNWALSHVDVTEFTHVGKLDGDIELPPEYLETLMRRFAEDPQLGLAGGRLIEPRDGVWVPLKIPDYHVHGALKLFSLSCFQAIGGIQERLAWDTIDETYARMRGFRTRSYDDLVARHHRVRASADGLLRGRARFGECAWILHYSLPWVALRSLKVATEPPVGRSGAAFLWGYLRSALRRTERVPDPEFRRFVRREMRRRMARGLRDPKRALAGTADEPA